MIKKSNLNQTYHVAKKQNDTGTLPCTALLYYVV